MNHFAAAILMLSLVCVPLYADDTQTAPDFLLRPASEAFQDKDTGLIFPARISEFSKVRVRRNLNPVFGTTVRYESESGNCADVYLYALDTGAKEVTEEQFSENCADTVKGILGVAGQSKQIRSVKQLESEFKIQSKTSFRTSFFRMQSEDGNLDSILVMALYRGRIVKLRITYDSEAEDEQKTAVEFAQSVLDMLAPPVPTDLNEGKTTEKEAETTGKPNPKEEAGNEGKTAEKKKTDTSADTDRVKKSESAKAEKANSEPVPESKSVQGK